MTQRTEIISYLLKHPNATTKEVQDAFSFPRPSTRRVLSNLRKDGINIKKNKQHANRILFEFLDEVKEELEKFEELEEEEEEENIFYQRKIVKSVWYCPNDPHRAGFGHTIFALTYEANDTNRAAELIAKLELGSDEIEQGLMDAPDEFFQDRGNRTFINVSKCMQATEWGYDDEIATDEPAFIYPEIEVGEE